MAQVALGANNKMEFNEALRVMGCSRTHLQRLVNHKKIKSQRLNGSLWLDADDVYKAKEHFIPRKRKPKDPNAPVDTTPSKGSHVTLKLEIERERYELMTLALKKKNKTVLNFIDERLSELYKRVEESLNAVTF